MAITYIVGIPRSGKTYYVMYLLWKFFVYVAKVTWFTRFITYLFGSKSQHNYVMAYTNINQFDFSKTDKIKKLDFDDLKLKLTELYNMFMSKNDDSKIIERSKELGLHNVLITIDEVQNFLGSKNEDVLVWWLTYHGHLFQDLYFITQDMGLIHSDYKKNAEFFYRAIPPSARLSTKKFRYTQYRNARMPMNGKIRDFTIPAIQEVFDMYVSGAENKSKSVVQKFLYIGLLLFMLLATAVLMFINSFSSDSVTDQDKNVTLQHSISVTQQDKNFVTDPGQISKEDKPEKQLFEILCIKDICKYKKVEFPKMLLSQIIKDSNSEFTYKIDNSTFTRYFLLSKKDTFNFLDFGGQDENSTKKSSHSTFNLL